MLSVENALKIVLREVNLKSTEKIDILSSLDRVLATDVVAKEDVPPFERAAMDGYAVMAKDVEKATANNPVSLKIIDDVPAGYFSKKRVMKGTAIRVMTGACMPTGADVVVMVEDTKEIDSNIVRIFKRTERWKNISNKGEDVRKGEVVITSGKRIKPADIGMFASLGISKIEVYKRPVVSIIATGDELVGINDKLGIGKIRNSNSYSLASQVMKVGGVPDIIGIAKDNKQDLISKIKKSEKSDILILSGGVSVGIYDLVKQVLQEIGVKPKFWKINIKPGKPVFFGKRNKQLVFGLPGYPVSSMLTFELFVRPSILKMSGNKEHNKKLVNAVLKEDIVRKEGRKEFVRAKLEVIDGRYNVIPTGPQGSGILKSLVLADCLIVVPENVPFIPKGSKVKIILLD